MEIILVRNDNNGQVIDGREIIGNSFYNDSKKLTNNNYVNVMFVNAQN